MSTEGGRYNDTRGISTNTFVKVAVEFFSKGWYLTEKMCETRLQQHQCMVTNWGKLCKAYNYVRITEKIDAVMAYPKHQNIP
jgi:hypothetical protein